MSMAYLDVHNTHNIKQYKIYLIIINKSIYDIFKGFDNLVWG